MKMLIIYNVVTTEFWLSTLLIYVIFFRVLNFTVFKSYTCVFSETSMYLWFSVGHVRDDFLLQQKVFSHSNSDCDYNPSTEQRINSMTQITANCTQFREAMNPWAEGGDQLAATILLTERSGCEGTRLHSNHSINEEDHGDEQADVRQSLWTGGEISQQNTAEGDTPTDGEYMVCVTLTWRDLTKVQSSVRMPSPLLSSLTNRSTRNKRKKVMDTFPLSPLP